MHRLYLQHKLENKRRLQASKKRKVPTLVYLSRVTLPCSVLYFYTLTHARPHETCVHISNTTLACSLSHLFYLIRIPIGRRHAVARTFAHFFFRVGEETCWIRPSGLHTRQGCRWQEECDIFASLHHLTFKFIIRGPSSQLGGTHAPTWPGAAITLFYPYLFQE